jgi:hypothetical protein
MYETRGLEILTDFADKTANGDDVDEKSSERRIRVWMVQV